MFDEYFNDLRTAWQAEVEATLQAATVTVPRDTWMHCGGRQGIHTEKLGPLLAEMQFLQRAYPNSTW